MEDVHINTGHQLGMTDHPPLAGDQSGHSDTVRVLASGSVRYSILENGAVVTAGLSPEVFVRVSGRGRILWADGADDARDPRALGLFLIAPEGSLRIGGGIHGLHVILPGLPLGRPTQPLSDVLIGLVCRRAWHGPVAVAETALVLARLLVTAEISQTQE